MFLAADLPAACVVMNPQISRIGEQERRRFGLHCHEDGLDLLFLTPAESVSMNRRFA